jgi:ACT domain-containing protein
MGLKKKINPKIIKFNPNLFINKNSFLDKTHTQTEVKKTPLTKKASKSKTALIKKVSINKNKLYNNKDMVYSFET